MKLLWARKNTSTPPRKGILCTTFIAWIEPFKHILTTNIARTAAWCSWHVVIYDPAGSTTKIITQELSTLLLSANNSLRSHVTMEVTPPKALALSYFQSECHKYISKHLDSSLLLFDQCKLIETLRSKPYNPSLFSKASMLISLLNRCTAYQYVWTLDGDISLHDYDVHRFFQYQQCAFASPPMVAQPLIYEPTQFYRYLYRWSWGHSSILVHTVGFVELQAAFFNAQFLEWFIVSFIIPLLSPMHILGSDWGLDEMYCTAAKQFKALTVSHASSMQDPICAVVIGGMAVHHNNTKTIKRAMGGKDYHLHLNYALMRIVHSHFRSYCSGGLKKENDPFNANNSYVASYSLDPSCNEKVVTALR